MAKVFAALLGLAAIWCVYSGFQARRTSGREALGYGIAAASALVQVLNILGLLGSSYSIAFSIVTTIGLLGGFALTRQPNRTEPRV